MTARRTARAALSAVVMLAALAIVAPSTTHTVATILTGALFALPVVGAVFWATRRRVARVARITRRAPRPNVADEAAARRRARMNARTILDHETGAVSVLPAREH